MIPINEMAEIYVPDGIAPDAALARTTRLCIAAHQDDIELMALAGIYECYNNQDEWFAGIVATDGAGSPRTGAYAQYNDDMMRRVRADEQKKAAEIGQYSAVISLNYPSADVKSPANNGFADDLNAIFLAARPKIVYTHNLADKHDTHIGVVLRTISALREMSDEYMPEKVIGCEVWRGLDWLNDDDKIVMDTSGYDDLASALIGVFDSQISGGKRYDLAAEGRMRANATYFASHDTDNADKISFGIDLMPLIVDNTLDIAEYMDSYIKRFADDVRGRIEKLS